SDSRRVGTAGAPAAAMHRTLTADREHSTSRCACVCEREKRSSGCVTAGHGILEARWTHGIARKPARTTRANLGVLSLRTPALAPRHGVTAARLPRAVTLRLLAGHLDVEHGEDEAPT